MDSISILVLGDPKDPRLNVLEPLREVASLEIGNSVERLLSPDSADVILLWSVSRPQLEKIWRLCPRVRWIHSISAGLDNFLFPDLAGSEVLLTNGRGVFSRSLAEFVIGAVLFFAKDFRRLIRCQQERRWVQKDVEDVHGQTMGIIGFGDIGQAVGKLATGLGMKILALRRNPDAHVSGLPVEEVFPPERLLDLTSRADYLVLATPLTEETQSMIGKRELDSMKKSSVLINIGRGPVVEEGALIEALSSGRIRGAALDVYRTEPLPAEHPFYRMENVLLSPHCADHTPGWMDRAMGLFLDNIERFRQGRPLVNVVDKARGY